MPYHWMFPFISFFVSNSSKLRTVLQQISSENVNYSECSLHAGLQIVLSCFHRLLSVIIGIKFSYVWAVLSNLLGGGNPEKNSKIALFRPCATIVGGAVTMLSSSWELQYTSSTTFCIPAHISDDLCCKHVFTSFWLQSVESRLNPTPTQEGIGVSIAMSNKMGG